MKDKGALKGRRCQIGCAGNGAWNAPYGECSVCIVMVFGYNYPNSRIRGQEPYSIISRRGVQYV